MADKVKEPPHYFRFKIEPITFIMQNEIPYAEGNAIKYLCRWRFKHKTKEAQIEDLKKENEARKKELVAIGEEQKKIHKYYKDQFSKNSGWRWWT